MAGGNDGGRIDGPMAFNYPWVSHFGRMNMTSTKTVGHAVVEALRREGISHVFGIVGAAFLDILDAMYDRTDIQFIGVRHEQAAALMADGYARVTGRPSVCLATNGPGVINLTYGVAAAYVAHSPMVILAPSPSREHQHRSSTQEFDQVSMFRPITKAAFQVTVPERIPDLLQHAFRVATSGKMGPVLVDLPRDIMVGNEIEVADLGPESYRIGQSRVQGDEELVDRAAQLLLSGQRPVIMVGGGVDWSLASQEAVELAELTGAALVTSYGRADAVPNSHPRFLGHIGRLGAPEAAEAVRKADVLLALGTRLSHSTTFYDNRFIQPETRIIQVDIDANEIGRNYPVSGGIQGDAKGVATQLLRLVRAAEAPPKGAWANEVEELSRRRWERLDSEGALNTMPLKPQRAYHELRKVIPHDAIISLDAGLTPAFGQDRLVFDVPRSLLISLDLGGLGFGFPEALGAKFALPERTVVNMNGDGGFLFNSQEMETAVRYGLNVITVIMNNGCWGSEKAYQKYAFNERYVAADVGSPDFELYARSFGALGIRVEAADQIGDAFREAQKAGGPSIIEVPVDPDEMPRPARLTDVTKERG